MPEQSLDVVTVPETITVDHVHAERWRDLAGIDPRGFAFGAPGTYVVATDDTGRQLAEIKINYVHDRRGCDRAEHLIYLIEKALTAVYRLND